MGEGNVVREIASTQNMSPRFFNEWGSLAERVALRFTL
jgi:hypothetical protein